MPLPTNMRRGGLLATKDYGIPVALYAADQSFDIEIERAPDLAGAPDPGSIKSIATVPGTQRIYRDELPSDGAYRHYRMRHVLTGYAPSGWTPWMRERPVLMSRELQVPAPVAAKIQEQPSETGTLGTLTLGITDPQGRVTAVEFQTTSGNGNPGAWVPDTSVPYSVSVALVDKHPSKIAYRVSGYDELGRLRDGSGSLGYLAQGVVPFAIGARPLPPSLAFQIDASGNLRVTLIGDSDTTSFKVTASKTGIPTDAAVRATGAIAATNRVAQSGDLLTLVPTDRFFLSAFGYNAAGAESDRATLEDLRFQPTAIITIGAVVAETTKLTYPFTLSDAVKFVEVFSSEYANGSEPATAISVENSGERVSNTPLRAGDGRASISANVSVPGNWRVTTFVPYDHNNVRGTPVHVRTRSATAETLPPAPTAAANTAVTATTITNSVTMPADISIVSAIRVYRDGVQWGADIPRTALGGAAQSIQHTGLNPSTSYSWKYKTVTAGGLESAAFSPQVTVSTAAGVLDAPVLNSLSRAGGVLTAAWSGGANNPAGTIYEVYEDNNTAGPYTLMDTTTDLTLDYLGSLPTSYCVIKATKSGWTSSVNSNERSA